MLMHNELVKMLQVQKLYNVHTHTSKPSLTPSNGATQILENKLPVQLRSWVVNTPSVEPMTFDDISRPSTTSSLIK